MLVRASVLHELAQAVDIVGILIKRYIRVNAKRVVPTNKNQRKEIEMKQKKSLRQLARELEVSLSYLSQVLNGKRPASDKLLSNVKQNVKHEVDAETLTRYNFAVLGNSLVVGQRTLDPPG